DTRDTEKPRAWLKEVGIGRLGFYSDPSARVFQDLKTVGRAAGMPTTLLLDPAGCELGTVAGPAEWASEDGVRLVTAALAKWCRALLRNGSEAQTLTSRWPPIPAATLARRSMLCCAASISPTTDCSFAASICSIFAATASCTRPT